MSAFCTTSPSTEQLMVSSGATVAGQFVGGDQYRPDRGGVLEGLALQPLLGAVLPVAHGDVVEHGEPGDRLLGLRRVGTAHRAADDDGQLGFPVDLFGLGRQFHGVAGRR